jgi:hypothetical protein
MLRATVKLSDLRDAFEFVSSGAPMEHEAYLCVRTGTFHWHSEFGDNEEELPADVDDRSAYIYVPHKNELDIGKQLALKFAAEKAPDVLLKVKEIFSRRGAYAGFKNLLESRNSLQQWYAYEEEATVAALRKWCADNEIGIDS